MNAKYLVLNNRRQWEKIKGLDKGLPKLYIEAALHFVIESINSRYWTALVVPT